MNESRRAGGSETTASVRVRERSRQPMHLQERLDEDGVHGSVFHLRGTKPGQGQLVVGFRDLRTKEVTHRKSIPVAVDGDDRNRP